MNDSLATRVAYKLDLRGRGLRRAVVLLHVAGGRAPRLPEPAQPRERHGAGRRGHDQRVAARGLPVPGGRHPLARRPHAAPSTPRAGAWSSATASACVVLKRLAGRAARRRQRPGGHPRHRHQQRRRPQGRLHRAQRRGPGRGHRRGALRRRRRPRRPSATSRRTAPARRSATRRRSPASPRPAASWTDTTRFCAHRLGEDEHRPPRRRGRRGRPHQDRAGLEHGEIPPSLHFETPNPQIDFAASPFHVVTQPDAVAAERGRAAAPRRRQRVRHRGHERARRAGGSAALPERTRPRGRGSSCVLSAKTATALERATAQPAPAISTAHSRAASRGRGLHAAGGPARLRPPPRSWWRAISADAAAAARRPQGRREGGVARPAAGAPWPSCSPGRARSTSGMGRGLYEDEPAFRDALDACCDVAARAPGRSTCARSSTPQSGDAEAAARLCGRPRSPSPRSSRSSTRSPGSGCRSGSSPSAMIGHSVGEYVAACLAGVFSLEDALALVAERGRLMQSMPPGRDAGGAARARRPCARTCGPASTSPASTRPPPASCPAPRRRWPRLEAELLARGVVTRALHTSHAFHSAMMDPILDAFRDGWPPSRAARRRIPFVSNVTGAGSRPRRPTTPPTGRGTCARRCASPTACGALRDRGNPVLLEVGPGNTLAALARQGASRRTPPPRSPPCATRASRPSDRAFCSARSAGSGSRARPRLGARPRARGGAGCLLPRYPFERERYWVEPNEVSRERLRRLAGPLASAGRKWGTGSTSCPGAGTCPRKSPPDPDSRSRRPAASSPTSLASALASPTSFDATDNGGPRAPGACLRPAVGHGATKCTRRARRLRCLLAALGKVPSHVLHLWGFTEADAGRRAPVSRADTSGAS